MTALMRRAALAAACLALSGCTLSASLRHDDIFSVWGKSLPPRDVFFVTDRAPDGAGFGQKWSGAAHCGRAVVPIANAVSPAAPDPALTAIPCEGAEAMAAFARRVAAATQGCGRVLIVVQGFNLIFRTALLHGAQVAMDSQWPCATLIFDWSSEGLFNRYAADIERSGYAVPVLLNLMRALGAADLKPDILGHSIGGRVVMSALSALCAAPAPLAGEVILAAADVSAEPGNDDFGRMLARGGRCVRRATIYASDNDLALMASQSVHGGVPRAGQLPLDDLQYAGSSAVDVVDAGLAPGDPSGHAYFVFSYEALTDFMWVLDGASLARRVEQGGLTCADWSGGSCAAGNGRYRLKVDAARQPGLGQRLLRRVWPLILPFE